MGVIMQSKQVFNPFLPLNECVPDGEPHIFDGRVYIYGSHDKEGGETFCMLDYVSYSAPVTDLSNWRYEGVIYRANQDPDYDKRPYMYAPDVVRGNDGRYYLYYCMSGDFGHGGYHGPIQVAVCDTPAGQYEYLGFVKHPDGTPMLDFVCFDPAAINDNGVIRIYYGTQYPYEEEEGFRENEARISEEMEMFNKSREEILNTEGSVMGPCMVVLEDDMVTVKKPAKHIIPYKVKGTDFEEHPFFEASSMRKIDDKYYFVYSSMNNHELCYATSDYPDRDFKYGGTIVSNGDVGYRGRKPEDRLNMTGTTHGSIICIHGQWYVFYHRLTHKSDYSRQACAEKIYISPEGEIDQVEITSCGLSEKPIPAKTVIPAAVCCNLTDGHMPHGSNKIYGEHFPHVDHEACEKGEGFSEDATTVQFVADVCNDTMIGYKYLQFKHEKKLTITARATDNGVLYAYTDLANLPFAEIAISKMAEWTEISVELDQEVSDSLEGKKPLYFIYKGEGTMEMKTISFA